MATPTPPPDPSPPRDSVEVRDQLVEALKLDLVGPWTGHPLETEQIRPCFSFSAARNGTLKLQLVLRSLGEPLRLQLLDFNDNRLTAEP